MLDPFGKRGGDASLEFLVEAADVAGDGVVQTEAGRGSCSLERSCKTDTFSTVSVVSRLARQGKDNELPKVLHLSSVEIQLHGTLPC